MPKTQSVLFLLVVEILISDFALGHSYHSRGGWHQSSPRDLPATCLGHIRAGANFGSGYYWIRPMGMATAVNVYCEQETRGGGWMRLYSKDGQETCATANRHQWTDDDVTSVGLDADRVNFAVSDNTLSIDVENSWILTNATWGPHVQCNDGPCSRPNTLNSVYNIARADVIAHVMNCKTPTGTAWSQSYSDGFIHVSGFLGTEGRWTSMHYGCHLGLDIGQIAKLRIGGGILHTGEFIHTACSDYVIDRDHSVTSRWNTNNTRAIWVKEVDDDQPF